MGDELWTKSEVLTWLLVSGGGLSFAVAIVVVVYHSIAFFWRLVMEFRERRLAELNHKISKLVLLGLVPALSGCAGPRVKTPCEFWAKFIIDDRTGVDKRCHSYQNLRDDSGGMVRELDPVLGCADFQTSTIVTTTNPRTIAHEVNHLIDFNCQQEDGE